MPPSRPPRPAPLTDDDVARLRSRVAAGEEPRVQLLVDTPAAAAGTRGAVVGLRDPAVEAEFIVLRVSGDDVPFSPAELSLPTRGGRADGRSGASAAAGSGPGSARSGPVAVPPLAASGPRSAEPAAPARTTPAPVTSAPVTPAPATSAPVTPASGTPVPATDAPAAPASAPRATGPAAPGPEATAGRPRESASPVRPAPPAPDAPPAGPAATAAGPAASGAGEGVPSEPRPRARRARAAAPAGPRAQPITLTLRFTGTDWTVETTRAGRRGKPAPVALGAVRALAERLDDPDLRRAVLGAVDVCREQAVARAEQLRAELERVETALAELEDD